MADALGVAPGSVRNARGTGTNDAPQCTMKTTMHGGTAVTVIANDELTQGAYFIVERTIDEASQIFGPHRFSPAPVQVLHVGLESSWFPEEQWMVSTDGYRVVTVSVDWAGAKQAQKIDVTSRVTLTYLHTPHGKQASAVAKTFP